MMTLFRRTSVGVLAIDINGDRAQYLVLDRPAGGPAVLAACGSKRIHEEGFEGLFKKYKHYSVRINIDDPKLIIQSVDIPTMPENEAREAVKYAFQKAAKVTVDDYHLRFHLVSSPAASDGAVKNRINYIVYALPKSTVEACVLKIYQMGISRLDILEPTPAAIVNLCANLNGDAPASSESVAVIHVSSSFSQFMVINRREIAFYRLISDIHLDRFREQIARDIGISADDAALIYAGKKNHLSDDMKKKFKDSTAIFWSSAALEFQRSIDRYLIGEKDRKISRILLSGPLAFGDQIIKYLSTAIELPVSLFDPFQKITVYPTQQALIENKKHYFAAACGLATDG